MADILFSSPGILLVSQNSFPDPRTHTDPGSLSTKTVRSTRVEKKNSDKNNNNTSLAVFTHYLSLLLVVMVMMMTNASVGFISSPSAAPAPRNSEAQVTSCFLEQ